MHSYYKILIKNASETFWEITHNQSFESAPVEEGFNKIIKDYQVFGNEIWTTISGLRTDDKSNEKAIQNVQIALMMISAFSRPEIITRKRPSTLVYKAWKDIICTS
jgi:hypothetical protein